ncbi:mucin-5AC-like [Paramacrobiotus metropolitanus]|uniref:mucin-5AC-like n=1 Tax=Paramacrobiotus metropolitanus TaxID=2943436 RepID=UPI00244657A7|nr:mucin-5AC-like [Paramacrobiotus metropolitanus]
MLRLFCALLSSINCAAVNAFVFVYSDQNGPGSQCSPMVSLSGYGCPCRHPGAACRDPGTICSLADENGYLRIQNPSAAFILLMVNELKCLCVTPWEKSDVLNRCVNDAVVATTPGVCINAVTTTTGISSTTTGTTTSATSTNTGTTAAVTDTETAAWTTTSKPTTTATSAGTTTAAITEFTTSAETTTPTTAGATATETEAWTTITYPTPTQPSSETSVTGSTTSAETSTSGGVLRVVLTPTNPGASTNLGVMKCYPQKNFTVATINITGGTLPYTISSFHSSTGCYGLDSQKDIVFEGALLTSAQAWYPCWTGTGEYFMAGQTDTVDFTVQDSSNPPLTFVSQLKVQIYEVDDPSGEFNFDNYRCDPNIGSNFSGVGEGKIFLEAGTIKYRITAGLRLPRRKRKSDFKRYYTRRS